MSRMIRRSVRGRARRRATAGGLVGALSLLGVLPATATADPSPSTTELHSRASNLALGDDDVAAEAAEQGPEDECGYPIPGLEERCEKWTAGSSGYVWRISPASDRLFGGGPTSLFTDGTWKTGLQVAARDPSTGEELWRVNNEAPVAHGFFELAVSPDGRRVYAIGNRIGSNARKDSQGGYNDYDIVVVALDAATGNQLWNVVLGLPGIDENDAIESVERATAITVSPDGRRIYLTGTTMLFDRLERRRVTHEDVIVAAYDAITGTKRWVTTWGARFDFERGRFIEVSPDSRKVYIGGEAPCQSAFSGVYAGEYPCSGDFLALGLQAYDPADPAREGRVLWASHYDGFGEDFLFSMDLAPNGSQLYLAGTGRGDSGGWPDFDYATVAFRTATGQQAWVSRYDGADPSLANGPHGAFSVAASPSGDTVFVTGMTSTRADDVPTVTGDVAVGTIAYDASTGQEAWTATFGLGTYAATLCCFEEELGSSIAAAPDGKRVYVGGISGEMAAVFSVPGTRQIVTLAYDAATGNQYWVGRVPSGAGSPSVVAARDGKLVFTSTPGRVWAYDASP